MNLHEKLWKGLGSPVIDVSIKRDSLPVDVLKFFEILAGRCGSVVVRERGYKRSEFKVRAGRPDPGFRLSFFLIETLSITSQKFSKCLKNGSDGLRKRQLLT